MTQRGSTLGPEAVMMRRTARAVATFAQAMGTVLLVVTMLVVLGCILPAASAAVPAMTRTRAVKPHHEFAQPVALVGRGTAKAAAREKHPRLKGHAVVVAVHDRASSSRRNTLLQHAFAQPPARPLARHDRHSSAHKSLQHVAAPRARSGRRGPAPGWREIAERREIAEHKAGDPKIQTAGVPRGAVAGGELTMDDFDRVASASSEGVPMVAGASPRPAAPVQRVEGFGAEVAVLSQSATLRASAAPATADLPDAVVAGVALGDPRVRALVHPSHEDMAAELSTPVVLPGLYRNGRLVVPAPMKGSHDILVHQNTMADDEGLERVRDEDELQRLRASRQLVDFPESASLHVNPELGYDRRCARVWTVKFAQDIAHAFYTRFHEPLQVNSAVRTVAYQLRLQRTNGNAAGIRGEASSPHLTGQAIDFGKRGMSVEQIAWMRAYLGPLMASGKVDVEEEFQQACFHISVYKSYLPQVPAVRRMQVAAVTRPTAEDQ